MEDIAELPFPGAGTCTAKGLPLCDPEPATTKEEIRPFVKIEPPAPTRTLLCDCVFEDDSETLEDDDDDDDDMESFREPPTIDDELQLEDIRAELRKKQQRVEQIDKTFELNTPECPAVGSKAVDMQVELNKYGVHPEILKLQRNNHKLRQQLKELHQCCTASDLNLKSLRTSLSRDLNAVQQLQRRVAQVDSFKRNVERERVLCSQRYGHLMREMYDWDECNRYIAKKLKDSEKDLLRFVARVDYESPKHEAVNKLKQTKLHVRDVYDEMFKNLGTEGSVRPSVRMGTDISAFLQRNMQLFSKESH
ncbi:hypothetical protein ACLKA6_019814 [Drosophila palustris]